jgi:hypothetical protein
MRAANITGATGALNAQAKSAARSAFESAKQRFFNHLITAMKTPSLIASVERDLKDGDAAVIPIVSTGEALMERRLAEIPAEEWADVQVDITPRQYVLDYLAHSFPIQLYEPFTTSEGDLSSPWLAEVSEVPEFTDSEIHIVAGSLLTILKRLLSESTRIYRLQTDTGERIIGRKVSPAWVASVTETGTSNLAPDAVFTALLDGKTIVDLTEALQLRRVRVMGVNRIELTGFADTMRERLGAYGLFSEIISSKLRFFVPVDATGSVVLAKVLEHYPVVRVTNRAAA